MKNKKTSGCKYAKVIQVIETRATRGSGMENDPVREVIQYWHLDGKLLTEIDDQPCSD